MNQAESIADWLRMYKSLTDPELKEKARREEERKKRREDKMRDTGVLV